MKKIIFAVISGLILSGGAMAQEDGGGGDAATTCTGAALNAGSTTEVLSSACALLNEDVRIGLSKDVTGAYVGDVANNVIRVATCHPNGRKNVTPAGADTAVTTGLVFIASSEGGRLSEVGGCGTGISTVPEVEEPPAE